MTTDLWTTSRIATVIRKTFRVTYHPDHVGRLLHHLKWTHQKPETRAVERDEAAIEHWTRVEWPRVKNARRLGAHLVFVDESGFLAIPSVHKTWAPRGQTPIIRHRYQRDKISVISGISLSPVRQRLGLYWRFLVKKNFTHPDAPEFLRHLLHHLRGHVIVLWDNGRIHKGDPVRDFCRRFPRLHLEHFPA